MNALHSPNSPNFNERGWEASQSALALANAPKGSLTLREPISGKMVTVNVDRLRALRPATVTDAQIETAKVVNRENETVEELTNAGRARLLGFTVKTLRAQCRAEGLKGYSKAKKADLVTMLLA